MADEGSLKLAELLCARLCHDLANPVGAVGNGVELIAELGGADAGALDLLQSSARIAADRLKFFRIAYGHGGRGAPKLGYRAALRLAEPMVGQRVRLAWAGPEETPPPAPGALKLMLNLVVLAGEAVPRGGTVTVGLEAGPGPLRLRLAVEPAQGAAALPDATAAALGPGSVPEGVTERLAHAVYTGQLARELGAGLSLATAGNVLTIGAVVPV